jgi:hypothetical protein
VGQLEEVSAHGHPKAVQTTCSQVPFPHLLTQVWGMAGGCEDLVFLQSCGQLAGVSAQGQPVAKQTIF